MTFEQVLPQRLARWVTNEPDWDVVFAEQWPRVLSFFRYRLGDDAAAEDLTARTFEKAWTARHEYHRDVTGFSTWLLTIARNVAIDHLRAREPHGRRDRAAGLASPEATPDLVAKGQSDPRRLATLLATLPPRQRELIAMKYGAEMTNRAIARATGLSEGRVQTILLRAVRSLRERW
jgi:RNA polymerase sigma factor (sigma-70 family)